MSEIQCEIFGNSQRLKLGREKLGLRIAEYPAQCAVDLQKMSIHGDERHADRGVSEGDSKLLLAISQLTRRLVSFGNVAHDYDRRAVIAPYQSRLEMTLLSFDRQQVIDLDYVMAFRRSLECRSEKPRHLGG